MPIDRNLTEEDARRALRDHVAAKAFDARERYGPTIDRNTLERLLHDPEVTRWPTELRFDATPLRPDEYGFAAPIADSRTGEWAITLHPRFESDEAAIPLLAAYHIVSVNYGEIATHVEAEIFGATLFGLEVDEYYEKVCGLVGDNSG